jgi:dolichol-phosphate mannosyltransferase
MEHSQVLVFYNWFNTFNITNRKEFAMKKISIVIPVYFNEENLPETIPRLLDLKNKLNGYQLELIFVDDGSKDKSLDMLFNFQTSNPQEIKIVKLTRNFGSMAAIQAGLSISNGDCVGVIAADLQDPPELFLDMIKHWEKGIKAVFAVRQNREDPLFQKILSNSFYALLRKYAISDYPKRGFDFILIDRQVVEEINKIKEKNMNLFTLIFWLGYSYVAVPYTRAARSKGKSRWTLSKKIKLFIDSFAGFSYFPIRILSILGVIFAITAFVYGMYVFYGWLEGTIKVEGYTTLMIVLTFTAGLQMTMLGVLGEYLWRTLDESRKRPSFVIDRIFGNRVNEL